MSDFKATMHQIRLRLGLCLRPRWGAYSAPPDPLAGFKGAASRQGGGRGSEGREMGGTGRGGEGRERKERMEEEGESERGNGRDWTGHGMGRGRERERRKGRESEERGYSPQTSIPGAATAWENLWLVFRLAVKVRKWICFSARKCIRQTKIRPCYYFSSCRYGFVKEIMNKYRVCDVNSIFCFSLPLIVIMTTVSDDELKWFECLRITKSQKLLLFTRLS